MRVVQFGEGVFLRGFADWMIHRLNHEAGTDIRVTLVQPRDSDGVSRIMAQSGRYHVLQQGLRSGVESAQLYLIDCIDSGLNTHRDPSAFEALARDGEVSVIISNTTEAGIDWNADDASRGPDAREELRSFPAKLTWFLHERFRATPDGKLYVLPCELIADNGQVLKSIILRLANAWNLGSGFEAWLGRSVVFFDTLVDRIVPGRPVEDLPEIFPGMHDEFPVQVEWFHSWYIKGSREVLDVLPLDSLDLNVHFVDDLQPYRDLKVRVLNGLHSSMAPVGTVCGLKTVAEAVSDGQVGEWLRVMLDREILPTLSLPAAETAAFARDTWDRFRNPFIHHQLRSILLNSTAKIPARIGDMVRDRAAAGRGSPLLAFGVAAWLWLSREPGLEDSSEALGALADLWERMPSAESVAYKALSDVSILGTVEWPSAFREDVALSLADIASNGPGTALNALLSCQ